MVSEFKTYVKLEYLFAYSFLLAAECACSVSPEPFIPLFSGAFPVDLCYFYHTVFFNFCIRPMVYELEGDRIPPPDFANPKNASDIGANNPQWTYFYCI